MALVVAPVSKEQPRRQWLAAATSWKLAGKSLTAEPRAIVTRPATPHCADRGCVAGRRPRGVRCLRG